MAGLLRWGPRCWPGIWFGSFLVNVWVSLKASNTEINFAILAIAVSIGAGSTVQALAGDWLLQRWVGVGRLFERGTAIFAFAAITALVCFLASTWGVTSLWLAGIVDKARYFDSWRTWWLGDLIGVLVVTPVILTWHQLLHIKRRPGQVGEAIVSFGLLGAITVFIFAGPSAVEQARYPLAFLLLPCLMWLAFRFVLVGVALAVLLMSVIAVGITSLGYGPFVREVANDSILLLQAFMGLVTIGLILATAVHGKKQTEAALQQLDAERGQRVRARTPELAEANRQLGAEPLLHQQTEEKYR